LTFVAALAAAALALGALPSGAAAQTVDPRCFERTGSQHVASSRLEGDNSNILVCEIPESQQCNGGICIFTPAFTARFELIDSRCFDLVDRLFLTGGFVLVDSAMQGAFLVCTTRFSFAGVSVDTDHFFEVVDERCLDQFPGNTIVASHEEGANLVCTAEGPGPFGTTIRVDLVFQPPIVVRRCHDPQHLVQCRDGLFPLDATVFGAIDALEAHAVADVLDQHLLPDADASTVMDYARNEVRARLFARLVEIFRKPDEQRTTREQAIADAYSNAVRHQREAAVEFSIAEYNAWAENPCAYTPPEGFTYTPRADACSGTTLIVLFDRVNSPTVEEFLAYGAAEVRRTLQDPEAAQIMFDTARNLQFLKALGLGVAASIGVVVALKVTLGVGAVAAAIFPWANAASFGVGALAVAGSAFIGAALFVIVAVTAGLVQGLFVFEQAAIPDKLQEALAQAQVEQPSVRELASTEAGVQELYTVFLETTLPDFRSNAAPPDRVATDPRFRITDASGGNVVVDPYIHFKAWDDSHWSARLSGGWFVPETVVNGQTRTTLQLFIEYKGWDGGDWIARRAGDHCIHMRRDSDPEDAGDIVVNDRIEYLDHAGERRIAKITRDTTPPVIQEQISGTLGTPPWYVSDVSLSWNVSDPETPIDARSGCDSSTITSHGTIKRDVILPTITAQALPAPNAAGWNNGDVQVTFTCNDATSGVASCTGSTTVTSEGANQQFSGTATDHAGNRRTTSITVSLDKTAPTITPTPLPAPNAAGWHRTDLIANFECSDALSGIDRLATDSGCGPNLAVFTETARREIVGRATDKAGNTASATLVVKLDKTPPTIVGTASPGPNAAGWNKTDVTVAFECSDALSGIASCGPNAVIAAEGMQQSRTGTAEDVAGNSSQATVGSINIDKTPPVVALTTPPDGITYVLNQVVPAQWSAADALSGLSSTHGTVASGQPVDTATVGEKTFTVRATDVAENVTQVTHRYTVLSAADASARLIEAVKALGLGLENSLVQKLQNAINDLQKGQVAAAREKIQSFINEVKAQRGKQIAPGAADALIAAARLILGAIP
jgi:hypothetical protein